MSNPINIFGVRLAPLLMPIHRRLETLSVAFVFILFLTTTFMMTPLCIYLLLCTQYWHLPIIGYMWIYWDRKTPTRNGRKWNVIKKLKLWMHFRNYFPIELIKTAELDPNKNYIFCVYPHGILCTSAAINFMTNINDFDKLFPGIDPHLVILDANFHVPVSRDMFLALGAISSSRESLIHCLTSKSGSSCVLMPGGAREALLATPGKYKILLKSRKGFVKVALQTGASLVPVFSFGENDLFDQYTGSWYLSQIQEKFRKIFSLAPCIIKGRGLFQYSFGILPQRRKIITVVGSEIIIPKVLNPKPELVNKFHLKYINELVSLFENYKHKYLLDEDTQLTIL